MKRKLMVKSLALGFLLSVILGGISVAEAQRGQHMMRGQPDQAFDAREDLHGYPGMMGPGMGMMGPGMGMMGPGMGMMGPGMGVMGPGMGMMGILELPDLTDEQRDEIHSIQREARRQNMEITLDIMDIRDDIMMTMSEDRPDPAEIRELQEAMSRKQGQIWEVSVENRNRIYDLLTQEQHESLQELQQRPYEPLQDPRRGQERVR